MAGKYSSVFEAAKGTMALLHGVVNKPPPFSLSDACFNSEATLRRQCVCMRASLIETAKRATTLDKEAMTDAVGNAKVVPLLVQAV